MGPAMAEIAANDRIFVKVRFDLDVIFRRFDNLKRRFKA